MKTRKMLDHLEALEILVNTLPDEISLYRTMKATRSTARGVQAKACAARVRQTEDLMRGVIAEAKETLR